MQDLAQPRGHPWRHILSPLVLDNMSALTEPQKAEAEGEETKVGCDGCGSMGSQDNVVMTARALQADSLGLKAMLCGRATGRQWVGTHFTSLSSNLLTTARGAPALG